MKKTETKSTVLLRHHLKALKLPTMTAECEKAAARCAKENVDHLGFLLQLAELTRAVGRALELGTADADAVRLVLEHARERPVGLFCLDGRPHLKLVGVPAPDLSAYAGLATGVQP